MQLRELILEQLPGEREEGSSTLSSSEDEGGWELHQAPNI